MSDAPVHQRDAELIPLWHAAMHASCPMAGRCSLTLSNPR